MEELTITNLEQSQNSKQKLRQFNNLKSPSIIRPKRLVDIRERELSVIRKSRKKSEETKKKLDFTFVGKIKEKIKRVRLRLGHANIKMLNKKQFHIINDKSFVCLEEANTNEPQEPVEQAKARVSFSKLWKKVDKKIQLIQYVLFPSKKLYKMFANCIVGWLCSLTCLVRRMPTIKMNNRIKLLFDFLVLALSLLNMLIFTISFFFDEPVYAFLNLQSFSHYGKGLEFAWFFQLCSLVVLMFDIFFSMNTTYIEAGVFVVDHSIIITNYLKKNFLLDVLAILPLFCNLFHDFMGISDALLSWGQLIFLVKIIKLKNIINNFEQIYQRKETYEVFINFLSLGSKIFLVAHFLACFWHFVSYSNFTTETWLSKINLQNGPVHLRYLYSLYWALTTMITVGYGDITPQNEKEVLMCMCSMILGCAVFGYALNKIGVIYDRVNTEKREFSKYINGINQYMINKSIENDLQVRVRNYLEFNWKEDRLCNKEAENDVYSKLSDSLRKEVLMQSHGKILKSIPFFTENFSEELIEDLVSTMKQSRFHPGEVILNPEECVDFFLYVIEKGEIGLFAETNQVISIQKGSFFGEYSFVTGHSPSLAAKGITFGTVYKIHREDFLKILKKHPRDYEIFCFIRDQISLGDNIQRLHIRCFSCGQNTHMIRNCPKVNFIPSKSLVISKAQFCPNQLREDYARSWKKKRDFSALLKLNNFRDRAVSFQNINFEIEEESCFSPSEMESVEPAANQRKGDENNINHSISHKSQGTFSEAKNSVIHEEEEIESGMANMDKMKDSEGAQVMKGVLSSDSLHAETDIKVPQCVNRLLEHQQYKQNLSALKPPMVSSAIGSPPKSAFEISFSKGIFLKSPDQSPVNPSPRINVSLSGSTEKEDSVLFEKTESIQRKPSSDILNRLPTLDFKTDTNPASELKPLVLNPMATDKRSPRGKFGQRYLAFESSPSHSPFSKHNFRRESLRKRDEDSESRSPRKKAKPVDFGEADTKTRKQERRATLTTSALAKKEADTASMGGSILSYRLNLNEKDEEERELFEKGFDSVKMFTIYFPLHNIDLILGALARKKLHSMHSLKTKEKKNFK